MNPKDEGYDNWAREAKKS